MYLKNGCLIMNKNIYERYINTVYALFICIAIIIIFISIAYTPETIRPILLSIATELLGVAVVFYLVNRVFGLGEKESTQKIDQLTIQVEELLERLQDSTSALKRVSREFTESERLTRLIEQAKDIRLVGYNFKGFLSSFHEPLSHSIENGAHLRIIIVDPSGKAGELIRKASSSFEFFRDVAGSLEVVMSIMAEHQEQTDGKIEVALLDWIPSCGITIIDPNKPNGYLKISIYPPDHDSPVQSRPHLLLNPLVDSIGYEKYIQQYELLWRKSKKVDIKTIRELLNTLDSGNDKVR